MSDNSKIDYLQKVRSGNWKPDIKDKYAPDKEVRINIGSLPNEKLRQTDLETYEKRLIELLIQKLELM